jgi:hypothetical protein
MRVTPPANDVGPLANTGRIHWAHSLGASIRASIRALSRQKRHVIPGARTRAGRTVEISLECRSDQSIAPDWATRHPHASDPLRIDTQCLSARSDSGCVFMNPSKTPVCGARTLAIFARRLGKPKTAAVGRLRKIDWMIRGDGMGAGCVRNAAGETAVLEAMNAAEKRKGPDRKDPALL